MTLRKYQVQALKDVIDEPIKAINAELLQALENLIISEAPHLTNVHWDNAIKAVAKAKGETQ